MARGNCPAASADKVAVPLPNAVELRLDPLSYLEEGQVEAGRHKSSALPIFFSKFLQSQASF